MTAQPPQSLDQTLFVPKEFGVCPHAETTRVRGCPIIRKLGISHKDGPIIWASWAILLFASHISTRLQPYWIPSQPARWRHRELLMDRCGRKYSSVKRLLRLDLVSIHKLTRLQFYIYIRLVCYTNVFSKDANCHETPFGSSSCRFFNLCYHCSAFSPWNWHPSPTRRHLSRHDTEHSQISSIRAHYNSKGVQSILFLGNKWSRREYSAAQK